MNTDAFQNIYFLGVGGIGMSALARWFNKKGCYVAGYDKTNTSLVEQLIREGIDVCFEDNPAYIPDSFHSHNTLVVYTPAVMEDNRIFTHFRDQGYAYHKRAAVLGSITEDHYTIAVAGTHGKTTTSSIVAHILNEAGKNVAAFIGGIANNFESNVLIPDKLDQHTIIVVEADEYDRSFLHLYPDIAIVTAIDADHLDIYGKPEQLEDAFSAFVNQIKTNGILIKSNGLSLQNSRGETLSYGLNAGKGRTENIKVSKGKFYFDFVTDTYVIQNIGFGMPGFHNIENALAAIWAGLRTGLETQTIKKALQQYKGVKRRFDVIWQDDEQVYIDDYAHHPEEIRALLISVKELFPGKHITAIFQPHLYSRTRDFAEGFAASLSLADALLLLDIYPAREMPIPGVNAQMILDKATCSEKTLVSKEQLLSYIKDQNPEVLLTIGAGDIGAMVPDIKDILVKKNVIEV